MHSKFVLLVSLIVLSSSLFSQIQFTKGELTMEVTNIVLSPETSTDSTIIFENIDRIISELNLKLVFTEDILSIIKVKDGEFGLDTILIVNDLVKMQLYLVRNAGYVQDTIIVPDIAPTLDMKIISKRELAEKRFGLNQIEYTYIANNHDTMTIIVTEDLALPSFPSPLSLNAVIKGTPLSMEMNIGIATIKYEVTSFTPEVINKNYISTDFSQMQNLTETLKPFFGEDKEGDAEEETLSAELEKEYGEYHPKGTNNDILIQIANEGYITEESLKYNLENKEDVDIPSIIEKLRSSFGNEINYFKVRDPKSIISDFKRWGLYSHSISTILSDTSYWSSISDYKKVKVLKFASMHDAYMTETARQQIVDNAKSIRFITDADESIDVEFVKGKIGIDEWYGQYDALSPLKQGRSDGVDEIYKIVKYMFEDAYKDQDIGLKVSLVNDKIIIESNGAKHILPIEIFYEEDYESEYNEKEDRYEYKEDVEYNFTFYRIIVDKIKQVAADNGLPQGYSVYTTVPLGPFFFEKDEYEELIERFPSLAHYEERLYLQKLVKKVYDPYARLNMYFPYHPNAYIGSKFGPGHLIDVNFDIQYVTTANKLKFIEFMRDNSKFYNFDISNIERDSISIINNLMEGSENLISYLGPIKLIVNKIHPITPKSLYGKTFTEKENGLSKAYYNIHRVLNSDLDISKFRYDKEVHKEYFMFEGKEYSIDPGDSNMMEFIGKHIQKSKSGKKFYRDHTFSVIEEVYFYLLPEHVNILKGIINLPI